MSLTNIRNDPCRVEKQMQLLTETGRYMLNVPGQGVNMPFQDDPFLRLQKWGANLRTNAINIDSDLKGLTRTLDKDCQLYNKYSVNSMQKMYPKAQSFVDQSRATHPAWMLRTIENDHWDYLFLDPQKYLDQPFHSNISSRIVEKDNFCA